MPNENQIQGVTSVGQQQPRNRDGLVPFTKPVAPPVADSRPTDPDTVVLTERLAATSDLLRRRIIEHTRRRLGSQGAPRPWVDIKAAVEGAEQWVARVWSEQLALSARRRGAWSHAALSAAMADGLIDGVSETLEILLQVGELDQETWSLVCGLFEGLEHRAAGSFRE